MSGLKPGPITRASALVQSRCGMHEQVRWVRVFASGMSRCVGSERARQARAVALGRSGRGRLERML